MQLVEKIKDIRRVRDNNKLVIFVGSGVSKNSNIPTWYELIQKFESELNYDKCISCHQKTNECNNSKINCPLFSHICQDDYLKIPELYYHSDTSSNHENYYNIITETLGCENPSNEIDVIIFRLLPHHIITTNFDKLLENSQHPNVNLFTIISKDEDLLSQNDGSHNLIKMHGDIGDSASIVLKESDYINYEQTHPLMEAYIRSLFIDHTFLFIGYSMSDYNLKIILSKINRIANQYQMKNRPKNYIILSTAENLTTYENRYFESNNLYVIGTHELTDLLLEKHTDKGLEDIGKKLYVCLDCILDESNDFLIEPLDKILYAKYQILNGYNKISFEDLKSVYSFKGAEMRGDALGIWDNNEYEKITQLLDGENKETLFIKKIFGKTGIKTIQYNGKCYYLPELVKDSIDDDLFELYLNNQYNDLCLLLDKIDDDFIKAYYYHICVTDTPKCVEEMERIQKEGDIQDRLSLINFKLNRLCLLSEQQLGFLSQDFKKEHAEIKLILASLSNELKNTTKFINELFSELFSGIRDSILKLENILKEHEERYSGKNNQIFFGNSLIEFWKIQAKTYDYYYYFKRNYLMLDYLSHTKEYFEPYLKAILCTYSPEKNVEGESFIPYRLERTKYELNEIDVDMFVKYTNTKKFISWLKQYKIKSISYENNAKLVVKFSNFCNDVMFLSNKYVSDQLDSFTILLMISDLSDAEVNDIINSILDLTQKYYSNKDTQKIVSIFESLCRIVIRYSKYDLPQFKQLLQILIDKDVINALIARNHKSDYHLMLNSSASYIDESMKKEISEVINSCQEEWLKCNYIYIFRKIIDISEWIPFLLDNLRDLGIFDLFILIHDGDLPYNEKIMDYYVHILDDEIALKIATPNEHRLPDPLKRVIESCIKLHMLGKIPDISRLKPYKDYSEYMQFYLDPESFDYKKVDMTQRMWIYFFQNERCLSKLKEHKSEYLTEELKQQFQNERLTQTQHQIIFGLLLDESEIWDW